MLRKLSVLLCAAAVFFSCTTTCPTSSNTEWQDFENHLVTSFNYYILKGKVSGTYFADDITKYGEEMEISIYGEYFDYVDYVPESEYVRDIFFRNLSNPSGDTFAPGICINARYIDVTGVPFDMSFDSSSGDVEIVTTYTMEEHEWKRESYTSDDLNIKGRIKSLGDNFWNPEVEGEIEISCKDYFDLKITDIECVGTIFPMLE